MASKDRGRTKGILIQKELNFKDETQGQLPCVIVPARASALVFFRLNNLNVISSYDQDNKQTPLTRL